MISTPTATSGVSARKIAAMADMMVLTSARGGELMETMAPMPMPAHITTLCRGNLRGERVVRDGLAEPGPQQARGNQIAAQATHHVVRGDLKALAGDQRKDCHAIEAKGESRRNERVIERRSTAATSTE